MSAQPQWESVDDYTSDLLALVAEGSPATPSVDEEWDAFTKCLQYASQIDCGPIYPNTLRPMVRGHVAPNRIGAFTNRALAQKLVEYTGEWQVSDDVAGRNGGKPARVMRWIGGAA